MSHHNGDRCINLSIEVSATPEQVWDAIATGPGVTAWMHHTEIEGRVGGRFAFDMGLGAGLNESGSVSQWDPPHRFATREVRWEPVGQSAPALLATEWLVESVSGDSCVVRIVMSGFGTGQVWDDEIEGMTHGMEQTLRHLQALLNQSAGKDIGQGVGQGVAR